MVPEGEEARVRTRAGDEASAAAERYGWHEGQTRVGLGAGENGG